MDRKTPDYMIREELQRKKLRKRAGIKVLKYGGKRSDNGRDRRNMK